ncbi:penicillin acylase family protein [Cupriavidus numazuensis]|uniref:Acyl-homoserine lactone acylase PvdQ n=1 Tax=Cupriavidus numazuensis TaxID=221992 RepID=A0ABM8TQN6_9BURK|nr:penicillin acylase family protein [Cupriavidus numazuensis]CAG2157969.1 Acyl-homoserine lactone acylase PvdQ [Cupriavidus numazuensis]
MHRKSWLAAALLACAVVNPASAEVEIRRTTDGIPHVRADSWRGVGIGYGYAQAEDALCTLAEGFVTYAGRRSYYFGPQQRPQAPSTFGQSTSLELDLFFRGFADQAAVEAYRQAQPVELAELVTGYAEGYNRYLGRLGRDPGRKHACAGQPWVQPIMADDIYRRMIAAGLAAGYARFIPEIVNAQPPVARNENPQVARRPEGDLRERLAAAIGEVRGLGSNMLAFGSQATGGQGSVLFGNPHWYWGGPDRFYQAHLTLPGKLDVAGVSFLGAPVIMIGFNPQVAWTHTVSAARRFGLFALTLDPADPTRYLVDGVSEPMQAVPVAVQAREPDGSIRTIRRTLYRTRFGPVADFGKHHAAFGWAPGHALAMRDVNAANLRVFRNFLRWNRAGSLDEFIAIQREEAAMPWTNTAAIGRGDARAWYADIGAVPNVPDSLRTDCATPLSAAFSTLDPHTPLLDGARSACDWRQDPAAAQPGAMPSASMPVMLREDYVANMNDSYWLANPVQPLQGFPSILGGEGEALSMRTREGHSIAAAMLAQPGTDMAARLRQAVLAARSYPAAQFKADLLARACGDAPAGELARACAVLRGWDGRAGAQDRGAVLWDAFWTRLEHMPPAELFAVPFSAAEPLSTPRGVTAPPERVRTALREAMADLARKGQAADAPLGRYRYVRSGGRRVPLYGGCGDLGYFTVACNASGGYALGPASHANTYLQVVRFGPEGVQADTLLAHGERETAVRGGAGAGPVNRYAAGNWLRFPFDEGEIARDPALRRTILPE